jgi:hypothetical protein
VALNPPEDLKLQRGDELCAVASDENSFGLLVSGAFLSVERGVFRR